MNYNSFPTRTIIYSPELSKEFGAVTASILYQQLNYWFSKKKQFFKYLAPPAEPDIDKTPHYKIGDSWTEELGFSIHEFRSAFDKMGVRYTSFAKYKKAKDNNTVFDKDGKQYLFASFIDKRNNLTYYVKNWEYDKEFQQRVFGIDVDKLPSDEVIEDTNRKSAGNTKKSISRNAKSQSREMQKVNLPDPLDDREEKKKYIEQNDEISSLEKIPEIKKEMENPSVGEIKQAPPLPASCQGAKSGLSKPLHRLKHRFKGTELSVSSDHWMDGINPKPDFADWVLHEKIKKNPNSGYNTLPNIVAEIINDCHRADVFWIAYQEFLIKEKLAEERAERIKAAKIQEQREAEALKAQAESELAQEAEMCGMSLDEYRDYKSQKQLEETENTLKQLHQRLKENAKNSLF